MLALSQILLAVHLTSEYRGSPACRYDTDTSVGGYYSVLLHVYSLTLRFPLILTTTDVDRSNLDNES
jgi:hypothetical protein